MIYHSKSSQGSHGSLSELIQLALILKVKVGQVVLQADVNFCVDSLDVVDQLVF